MRVLQVTHHTAPCIGGIEKFVLDFAAELKKNNVETSILCLDRCPNSSKKLLKKEAINGVEIRRITFVDLKYYKIVPEILNQIKEFDILHIHNIGFFSDFLAITKPLHRKKLVLNTHGGFFHTSNMSFLKKIYFHTALRIALIFFDKVIADSKNDEGIFLPVAGKKLELIGNGVDLEPFLNLKGKKQKNSFLFIGRLSSNKGLKNLVKTFEIVVKKNPSTVLKIIGEDFNGIEEELKQIVISSGIEKNIKILGQVSKHGLLEEIKTARFAVSASEYEGFGIAVIEQMAACEIPVLSGIQNFQWFTDNGKAGFIIDFSNHGMASEKILEIMEKKPIELLLIAKKARKIAQNFDMKNVVKKYSDIYHKVFGK